MLRNLNALWVAQTATNFEIEICFGLYNLQCIQKYVAGYTIHNSLKKFQIRFVQTAIHLKKFILAICNTNNVKGAEKIFAGYTIRNNNIY